MFPIDPTITQVGRHMTPNYKRYTRQRRSARNLVPTMTVDVARNRWAKHAAERDQKIQSAAIAMRVLLPEVSEEKIQNCLRENNGDANLAWHQLQDPDPPADPAAADSATADPAIADPAADPVPDLQVTPQADSDSEDSIGAILAAIEVAEMADVAAEAPSGGTPAESTAETSHAPNQAELPEEVLMLVREVAETVEVPKLVEAPSEQSGQSDPLDSKAVDLVKDAVEDPPPEPSTPAWLPMLKPQETKVKQLAWIRRMIQKFEILKLWPWIIWIFHSIIFNSLNVLIYIFLPKF